jgi:hypothetical protein
MKKLLLAICAALALSLAPTAANAAGPDAPKPLFEVAVEPTLEFDKVHAFHEGLAWVEKDGCGGFVDDKGKVVIPLIYDGYGTQWYLDEGAYFKDGLATVRLKNMSYWLTYPTITIDKNGKAQNDQVYGKYLLAHQESSGDSASLLEDYILYRYYENENAFTALLSDKWGVVEPTGKIIVPFEYDGVSVREHAETRETVYMVQKEHMFGLLDASGNEILHAEYNYLGYNGAYFIARKYSDGADVLKYGMIDASGSVVIPFEYDGMISAAREHGEMLIRVVKDSKTGLMDAAGNVVIPCQYDKITKYYYDPANSRYSGDDKSELNLYAAENNGKYTFITPSGKVLPLGTFDSVAFQDYDSRLVGVSRSGKYGAIAADGSFAVPLEYDSLERIRGSDGFIAENGGKLGVVDNSGKMIIPAAYASLKHLGDSGGFIAEEHYKFGIIDKSGDIAVPIAYDRLEWISNDRFIAMKDDELGIINGSGKFVLPPGYSIIDECGNNFMVCKDEKFGIVNAKGNTIIKPEYDEIEYESSYDSYSGTYSDYYKAWKNDILHFIDSEWRITKLEGYDSLYDCVSTEHGMRLFVKIGKKCGVLDLDGNIIVPTEYGSCRYEPEFNAIVAWTGSLWPYVKPYEDRFAYDGTGEIGLMGLDGSIIVPLGVYWDAGIIGRLGIRREDNVFLVKKEGLCGIFDMSGNVVAPIEYELVDKRNDCWQFKKGDQYCYFDTSAQKLLNFDYDTLEPMGDSLYIVSDNGKYGMVDGSGETIAPIKYGEIGEDAIFPLYVATIGGQKVFISKKGTEYEYFEHGSYAESSAYDLRSYIDDPPAFAVEKTNIFSENLMWVKQDGKYGIVRLNEYGASERVADIFLD